MDLKPGGANPQARRALLAAAIATTAVLGTAGLAFAVSSISLSESGSPSGSSTTVDDDTSSTDDTVDDSSTSVEDDDDDTSSTDSTVDDSSTSVDDDTSSTDSTVDDSSTSVEDSSTTVGGQAPAPFDKTFATVAGTVVVQIDEGAKTVTLQSVVAAPGWQFEIHKERTDRVEIRFESGDGSKVRVEARFEDGVYREEVRTDLRDDDDDDNAGTVTTVDDDDDNAGTVTTVDDDDDDDDHSGSGSGSGSGSDDSGGGGGGGDNSGRDHPEDD